MHHVYVIVDFICFHLVYRIEFWKEVLENNLYQFCLIGLNFGVKLRFLESIFCSGSLSI